MVDWTLTSSPAFLPAKILLMIRYDIRKMSSRYTCNKTLDVCFLQSNSSVVSLLGFSKRKHLTSCVCLWVSHKTGKQFILWIFVATIFHSWQLMKNPWDSMKQNNFYETVRRYLNVIPNKTCRLTWVYIHILCPLCFKQHKLTSGKNVTTHTRAGCGSGVRAGRPLTRVGDSIPASFSPRGQSVFGRDTEP